MKASIVTALLAVLAPLTCVAEEPLSAEAAGPVNVLKSSLPSTLGFEVEHVRTTDAGVACITYRVSNDKGGKSKAQAVVEGDKVLRSSARSSDFAKAWNSKCVKSAAT